MAELSEALGQTETSRIEAGHASLFVSGWRPAIAWAGAGGIVIAFIVHPLSVLIQHWSADKAIPEYPVENLMVLASYLLGWSGIRAYEKQKGTAFSKLGENPGMALVTTVAGSATPGVSDKLPIATHEGEPPTPTASEPTPVAPAPATAPARFTTWP